MLEDLGGDDPVEGAVGEREGEGVSEDGCAEPAVVRLLSYAGKDGGGVLQLDVVAVEGHHVRPPAAGLEGVTAPAAPQVQQALAGPQPETVVIHGQHGCVPSTARYCSTVARAVAAQV